MAQKSRCINYNLPRIKTLADKLGYSPARTAIEVENWQDTNNKGWAVVPTIEEMGMDFIPWGKNIELYKKYNLITTDNQIKSLSEKEANSWVSTNNQNGAYYFEVKKNEKGKFFISMAKRLWDRTKFDSQLSLFDTDTNVKFQKNQINSNEGTIASEKTIRDLAARLSDRIGMPVRFESDRTKDYKGKIENGIAYINLAYATLDTAVHEILGHPIIRVIKSKTNVTKRQQFNFNKPFFESRKNIKTEKTIESNGFIYDVYRLEKYLSFNNTTEETYKAINFQRNEEIHLSKEEFESITTNSQLYQNLLKELETGVGKEVLDRIKRDYISKSDKITYKLKNNDYDNTIVKPNYLSKTFNTEREAYDYVTKINPADQYNVTVEKITIKGRQYTLEEQQEEALVELLGLMTANKLDNVKDGKLISLLKRLLKEMKVFVRSLLNQKEVEIDKLPDNMSLGDLSDLLAYSNSKLILPGYEVEYTTPDNVKHKTYQEASNHISKLANDIKDVDLSDINISNKPDFSTIIDFVYEGAHFYKENGKWFEDSHGFPIEMKENYVNKKYNESSLTSFIEKNKEYEQSKKIIEEWKKVNNIQYNPEEVYSRGQEFISVLGAYSDFDVNLMMQNLLLHIEDNEKAGGKFAISAITKPIDGKIRHLEGGGGKIKFKINPQSEDILWASNVDVYSGSVWDASEKVNKDKKSELLGVSYTKYPSLRSVNTVQPNLANVIDDLAHHHNELGITLTGNNFRLEYDDDIPYSTKKIIDSVNKILDQKYGKLVKPNKEKTNIKQNISYDLVLLDDDGYVQSTIKKGFKTKEKAEEFGKINSDKYIKYSGSYKYEKVVTETAGIQPIQTNETLTESIDNVRNKINFETPTSDYGWFPSKEELDDMLAFGEMSKIEYDKNIKQIEDSKNNKLKPKDYTSQALINTKIAALKEVAKKYPRSLIRSEVTKTIKSSNAYNSSNEGFGIDEMLFQKVPSFNINESQLDIYNELIKTNAVKSADEKEYIVNGESGYKRATSLVRKKFNLNNLNTSTSQDLGDIFHAVTANYIANEFAEFNTHYKPVVLEGLDEATILNVHAIIDPIINKAKAEGSVLIVELPVASSKRKVAGTIDLLEITSDKKLRMLDYKTTMFNKNIANTIKTVIGNSDQQVIYKNILKENDEKLGRQSRNVEFQELLRIKATNNNGIKYQVIETVPIIYQASTNKKRNAMLSNLFLQIEELLNKRNMSNAEKTDRVLEAKYKLMIKLQTDASNQEILTEALGDLAAIENIMSQGVDPNLDYSSYRTDLDLYKRLAEYIKPETTAEKALVREIVGQAEILFQELYEGARESFVNKVVEDLKIEGGPIQTADDVLKPVKDINSYQSYALGTSYSENPIVIGIYKQIQERLSVARTKSSILSREVALMVDELKAFTGKTGDSIYDNFLQTLKGKKTGYLVRQFRSEFYEGVTLAKAKGDLKWFSDNSTFDVEKYKLAKQKFQDILTMSRPSSVAKKIVDLRADEKFKDTSDEEILKVADKFVSINNDEALAKWVTDHKSISMYHIPNSNWTDSKWNDIKNGKFKGTVIERFYDKYTSVMEEIENVGLPFYVSENYIPDFKKNFIDRLMSTGVGNLKLGKSLYDSLSLPFDETEINKINPYTGEFIRSIPVLGKKSFATSEERNTFVEQDKSYDLAYSLAVFYESSLRHQELKTVESSIEVAKAVLHNQKEKVVNSVGEGVEGGFDQSKLAQGLKNEIERLEYFINATVYGKTNNKEVGIAITGNAFTNKIGFLNKGEAGVLSLDKLLNTILKYTGLNNIGYNMYAPVTNILGGKSMQWLMGIGGRWYNAKDYNFATAVVTAGPFSKASEDIVKANLFVQMLDPQINEFIQKEFELTKSDPKILHKVPGPFYAMQWSEDHMQKSGLIAMIKSDKHSVKWSDYKVVNDKLVFVGAVELEEGVVEAFRQKVIHVNGRALGNMNPDDKIRLKGHFLGRAIIQHRGWIPAILQSHWSNRKYDYQLQEYVEGRFNSLSTFIFKKSLTWTKLDEVERANVREALAEISIIIASMMLIALIKAGDTDDDKKRRKQLAFFIRVLDRYHAEITFFTPFEISGKAQILISPAPAVSSIKNVGTFLTNSWQMLWGEPEEAEKAQKKFTKSSIRLLPLYSQGERFINEALYQDINSSK